MYQLSCKRYAKLSVTVVFHVFFLKIGREETGADTLLDGRGTEKGAAGQLLGGRTHLTVVDSLKDVHQLALAKTFKHVAAHFLGDVVGHTELFGHFPPKGGVHFFAGIHQELGGKHETSLVAGMRFNSLIEIAKDAVNYRGL